MIYDLVRRAANPHHTLRLTDVVPFRAWRGKKTMAYCSVVQVTRRTSQLGWSCAQPILENAREHTFPRFGTRVVITRLSSYIGFRLDRGNTIFILV